MMIVDSGLLFGPPCILISRILCFIHRLWWHSWLCHLVIDFLYFVVTVHRLSLSKTIPGAVRSPHYFQETDTSGSIERARNERKTKK